MLKASVSDTVKHEITVEKVFTKAGFAAADWKSLNVKKLFVKAYPTISLVKKDTSSNEIILKITNPSDSPEDVTITKLAFNGSANVKTLSLNDQTLSIAASEWAGNVYNITGSKQVTLAAGESTELRFEAAWSNSDPKTASLDWIEVEVDGNPFDISNDYTNVGKWADFKITYKS